VAFAKMPSDMLSNDAQVLQAYNGEEGRVPVAPTESEIQAYTRMLNQPGEIQPHGFFMLIQENEDGSRIVRACSENVTEIFGRSASEATPKPQPASCPLVLKRQLPLLNRPNHNPLWTRTMLTVEVVAAPPPPLLRMFHPASRPPWTSAQ
jgi:hypothetical protein